MHKPSAPVVLAVLLALSCISLLTTSPLAQESKSAAVQKWEYRAAFYDDFEAEKLNEMGADGWELVAIRPAPGTNGSTQAVLKRPIR